jgi:predicted nucleotidyltransferase
MIFKIQRKKTTRNIAKEQSHRCIYNIIEEIINTRKKGKTMNIIKEKKSIENLHRRISITKQRRRKKHR